MKRHGLAVLAAGAALLAPTGAFASVESFTHTITNVTDTDLFSLPAFDLALGTLESVNLTLTVGSTSTVSFAYVHDGFNGIYPNAVFIVSLDPSVAAPGGGVSLYLTKLFMTPVTFDMVQDKLASRSMPAPIAFTRTARTLVNTPALFLYLSSSTSEPSTIWMTSHQQHLLVPTLLHHRRQRLLHGFLHLLGRAGAVDLGDDADGLRARRRGGLRPPPRRARRLTRRAARRPTRECRRPRAFRPAGPHPARFALCQSTPRGRRGGAPQTTSRTATRPSSRRIAVSQFAERLGFEGREACAWRAAGFHKRARIPPDVSAALSGFLSASERDVVVDRGRPRAAGPAGGRAAAGRRGAGEAASRRRPENCRGRRRPLGRATALVHISGARRLGSEQTAPTLRQRGAAFARVLCLF